MTTTANYVVYEWDDRFDFWRYGHTHQYIADAKNDMKNRMQKNHIIGSAIFRNSAIDIRNNKWLYILGHLPNPDSIQL